MDRFGKLEYVTTGLLTAGTIYLLVYSPEAPYWKGPNRLDEWVRRELRAKTKPGRHFADRASDVVVGALLAQPVLIDPILTSARGSTDVAYQNWMISNESLALSLAAHSVAADIAGRERPFGRLCVGDEESSLECTRSGRYRSFYSGHTTMAFTSAGLYCNAHAAFPIYGSRAADLAGCGVAMAAATTVGILRIVADRHYATDVLLGGAIGMASGLFVPWFIHYRPTVTPPDHVASTQEPLRPAAPIFAYAGTF